MIEESYVSFKTAKILKDAGFNVPICKHYTQSGATWTSAVPEIIDDSKDCTWFPCPTQALASRWLREAHNIDVMVDVYNRDYYVCNVYKNKHLMIIRNIVTSSFEKALEEGLCEAIKLIKK